MYIERWLKAPAEAEDGTRMPREPGTPQGGVISPLLANIFLHHAFDPWMAGDFPGCPFERYADDIVIHRRSSEEAQEVRRAVEQRLLQCKLEAHPEKTRIVYCRDSNRTEEHPHKQFDFLGYGFKPRRARNRHDGRYFVSFAPAIGRKAMKAIVRAVRDWGIHAASEKELDDFSRMFNRYIRGWVNYYSRYYPCATSDLRMHQQAIGPMGHEEIQAIPRTPAKGHPMAATYRSREAGVVRSLATWHRAVR